MLVVKHSSEFPFGFVTVGYVSTVYEFYDKYMKKGRITSTIDEWIEFHNKSFGEESEHLISRHSSVLNQITILKKL